MRTPKKESRGKVKMERSVPRYKHSGSVAYSQNFARGTDKGLALYRFGSIVDISERGLCFKAEDDFDDKNVISFYLKVAEACSPIRILGKIMWMRPENEKQDTKVGVRFIGNLPPHVTNHLLSA